MRNAIFIIFDDDYAQYAIACLKSLQENYTQHPQILACYDGNDEDVLTFLDRVPNLTSLTYNLDFLDFTKFSPDVAKLHKVYFRYILWTDRFSEYDTILHLDVDTLVLEPLDYLFLQNDFFAVYDHTPFGLSVFKKSYYHDQNLIQELRNDGFEFMPGDCRMMNAGVFTIPKKYRTRENFKKLVDFTVRYEKYIMFYDQSAISLWCYYMGIHFSEQIEYNFQVCFLNNPKIFYDLLHKRSDFKIHLVHFSWWKPDTVVYQLFIKLVGQLIQADKSLHSYLEEYE